MRKSITAGIVAASALTGGVVGLTVFGPSVVGAKSGSSAPAIQQAASPTTTPGTTDHPDGPRGRRGHRGFLHEGDAAAKAIGISAADLRGELRAGKTIAQVAKAHGVATQKVIDAMVAEIKTHIAADVKAGRITQAQADKVQTDLTTRITDAVNGTIPPGRGDHKSFGPGFAGPGMRRGSAGGAAAAKAIGISQSDLATALRSGKSIAEVAKAHGVTTQKVVDAMVTEAKARIAADVKAARITQAQADKIQADLTKRITDIVNGTFRHGDGPDHRGHGFGKPSA